MRDQHRWVARLGSKRSAVQLDSRVERAAGQHPDILELLEVPQLMETCVRNASYDEALDMHSYIARLKTMHPDVRILQLLMEQVVLRTAATPAHKQRVQHALCSHKHHRWSLKLSLLSIFAIMYGMNPCRDVNSSSIT